MFWRVLLSNVVVGELFICSYPVGRLAMGKISQIKNAFLVIYTALTGR
jgi:hypothetical protein